MIRLINLLVIAALVVAAAHVYQIKFESTQQAERLARIRQEIRSEHDAIARLRAEWSKLDNPARIQELAKRHLALKPMGVRQFDQLKGLPERPPDIVPAGTSDPIAFLIDKPAPVDPPTGTVKAQNVKR